MIEEDLEKRMLITVKMAVLMLMSLDDTQPS